MNIGFHYYVTRTLAEQAGFPPGEAQVIAYACQYIDNCHDHDKIPINGLPPALYERMGSDWLDPTCTSHSGIQNILYNFDSVRTKVLLPFHFIPGGWNSSRRRFDYLTPAEAPLALQLVRVALEKLRSVESGQFRLLGLIRLGIALHTYEDSFAHQNFSARNYSRDNGVSQAHIVYNNEVRSQPMLSRLTGFLGYKIGHGLLLTYPDDFGARITYSDGRNRKVRVDNFDRFRHAALQTYHLLRQYTAAPDHSADWLPRLEKLLKKNWRQPGNWLKAFSAQFPEYSYGYSESGWKNEALEPGSSSVYEFRGDLKWLFFHLAAYEQRQAVMGILPQA